MVLAGVLGRVKERLGAHVLAVAEVSSNQAFIRIPAESAVEANRIMFEEIGARFATATGVDERDFIEVLYHYAFDLDKCTITLKARAAKPDPQLDSIANIIPGALWIEREMHDLLGIEFKNHPDMRKLVLSDDWPQGVYPLRRGFREDES